MSDLNLKSSTIEKGLDLVKGFLKKLPARPLNRVILHGMDHELLLPVDYKGKELEFPFSIVPQGYVYKFIVQVEDAEVVFERDDGGELRALIQNPEAFTGKMPEAELLQAIAETIEELQS